MIGRASAVWRKGLFGLFLCGHLIELLLVRAGLLCAVELEDGSDPNAVSAYRLLGLLGRVLGVANLALDLYVCALLERGRELTELPEDDAAMPFGMLDVFAARFVLVGGLGGNRERGELLVVFAVANLDVVAKVADEGSAIEVHGSVSVFKFPNLVRVTPGEA